MLLLVARKKPYGNGKLSIADRFRKNKPVFEELGLFYGYPSRGLRIGLKSIVSLLNMKEIFELNDSVGKDSSGHALGMTTPALVIPSPSFGRSNLIVNK